MKKHTQTKAKLPYDERIIGGDVPKGMENKTRKKEMEDIYKKVKKDIEQGKS